MTSPAAAAFRAELEASAGKLDPAIRGGEDKVNDKLSEELRVYLKNEYARLKNRRVLEAQVLTDLDALEANGYPELTPVELPANLFEELQREGVDDDAFSAQFAAQPQAVGGSISIPSTPAPKP